MLLVLSFFTIVHKCWAMESVWGGGHWQTAEWWIWSWYALANKRSLVLRIFSV